MDLNSILEDFSERDWATAVEGGPLRIAVVGLGWFGTDVGLPAIDEAENCEPAAVVSGTPEKAERVARGFDSIERALTYEEFREGVGTDDYDAVYVATPNATHLDHAEAAADLGKHVICEKPLEATADRARRLVEACDDAGVTLMTAYRMQLDPAARRMRELVAAGAVGEVVRVDGSFAFPMLGEDGDPDQWRLDRDLAGGGALPDVGVYPLNTGRFVLDEDPVAVSAHTASVHDPFEEVDEHVTFRLDFDGGVVLTGHASFESHPENYLTVTGTEGRLTLEPGFADQEDRTLTLEREETVTVTDSTDEIVEQFDYFAQCALSGATPEPDGRDGLRDVEIIEAIYESAESGERVDL